MTEPVAGTARVARVDLRVVSASESRDLVEGVGRPAAGLRWAADYPTGDTVVALRMLTEAYALLGRPVRDPLTWWLHQIVVAGEVVGDIGFHGPPDERGAVELGYCVVPSWRGRGVATAACRALVRRGRAAGARVLLAEAAVDNLASRAVLRRAGFRWLAEDRFVA